MGVMVLPEKATATTTMVAPDKEQMQAAVRSVQSKLLSSLRAPQRPLLDLGVGFSYELDTADASLLVSSLPALACHAASGHAHLIAASPLQLLLQAAGACWDMILAARAHMLAAWRCCIAGFYPTCIVLSCSQLSQPAAPQRSAGEGAGCKGGPRRPYLGLGKGGVSEQPCPAPVQVRLKVKDWFSVRLLPHQVLKVNKRWQLGASPVALRVNYECPLDNLANPLAAPAKLMVR